ncbi:pullulanase [Bacillus sp. FJAT-45037]|uniref:pullulanase n=1 Tax=Bacillus sp. FJAT-45037 TaxID=2011007 RepID=UPI000C23811D|nr:pullulanase [Bacillus sp. FJAT-45037]
MSTPPIGNEIFYLSSGEVISSTQTIVKFVPTENLILDEASIRENLKVKNKQGRELQIKEIEIKENYEVDVIGEFQVQHAPFTLVYKDQAIPLRIHWEMIDTAFAYEGELGARLQQDGSATLTLWSPLANKVSIILYDKDDQFEVVKDDLEMQRDNNGTWQLHLHEQNTEIDDLTGYYYHYVVDVNGQKKLGLDPYAKSMAAWDEQGGYSVGKAAIVNPGLIGPTLEHGTINGYEKREDAIIYEIHVRDFTSDPTIESDLDARFGTFTAFIDKLDYIKSLGVTHIQLLPVMSYYKGNEKLAHYRELEHASVGANYNWGYDPHSYFSPSGMYSQHPQNALLRIKELKELINEIHRRGLGVMLDVVYNHTAAVEIFENLMPNYYHFMDRDGTSRTSFGGGRLGTTHHMARRILIDSIAYWIEEYKIDGFRFDMMGDHDAETIQLAYDKAKKLHPSILMIGEGWRTYVGDEGSEGVMAADQDWMQHTDSVGVFSDDFRNELKSGYGSEGLPRFLTNGARNIAQIFENMKAQPHNFIATSPGDVVQYIEAHDNLTLHDVIAQSIKKDPDLHQEEIQKRIRLGHVLMMTSQGIAFLHAGQEYGRTKQFRAETTEAPYKSTHMMDEAGSPFRYPYFIHDSYQATDQINRFDWAKATNDKLFPLHTTTRAYTEGLIRLRRSTNAFRLGTKQLIDDKITLLTAPEIGEHDLFIAYKCMSTDGTGIYYGFVNADVKDRTITLKEDLTTGIVVVDQDEAGAEEVSHRTGFVLTPQHLLIEPLTAVVIKMDQ